MSRTCAAIVLAIGCSSTQHNHDVGPSVATGTGSASIVCDSRDTCESELGTIKKPACSDYQVRCSVVEHGAGADRTLITEAAHLTLLAYDPTHTAVWVVGGGRIFGVGTTASPGPGATIAAPAIVSDARDLEGYRAVDGGRLVVLKAATTFRIWEVASGRAVEVSAPGPEGSGYSSGYGLGYTIGDHAIGYCKYDHEQLWWSTIDLSGSLDDGHGRVEAGTAPGKSESDAKPCATAHAH